MNRTASVVTMEDLKIYFKGWTITNVSPYRMELNNGTFEIAIKAEDPQFKVSVESIDDPLDSKEEITEDPLKFLEDFFGFETGVSKISSPSIISEKLHIIAAQVELGEITLFTATNKVRRISVKIMGKTITSDSYDDYMAFKKDDDDDDLRPSEVKRIQNQTKTREELIKAEMSELKTGIEKHGWKVKESISDNGLPSVEVNVSDMYKAEIVMENIQWKYTFSISAWSIKNPIERGLDKNKKKLAWKTGVTDDPIAEFRRYYRSNEVQKSLRAKKDSNPQDGKKSDSEMEKTIKTNN